eukprot:CAMPEP_0180785086 /NCGR_PEP_ID=MMETSP1038_2-20121128/49983_1 /TAXON_ID=632150 /ORGANISM="Azadinium spinosum, Strain 3D9" /LENGTH=180 /DNA_ID=CAMNT_0022821925 /DNA_START=87 /DNA_END=625 /DNA_ORIENTATION=+
MASSPCYACEILVKATVVEEEDRGSSARAKTQQLVEAAAEVTIMALGHNRPSLNDCIPYLGPGGPGNTPGDGPSSDPPDPWGWQSCTETLHQFSAHGIRNFTFSLDRAIEQCKGLYGAGVRPDTAALARMYGGFALANGSAGVRNLIWSHGTLDPWGGWFRDVGPAPTGSAVYHFLMEGA